MGVLNSSCCCKGHDDDKTSVGFYKVWSDEEENANEMLNRQIMVIQSLQRDA